MLSVQPSTLFDFRFGANPPSLQLLNFLSHENVKANTSFKTR